MSKYQPPAGVKDFDRSANPAKLYDAWDDFIGNGVASDSSMPAWYDPAKPPSAAQPQTAAPPWTGLPRRAAILNSDDVFKAAKAIDAPVAFGSGADGLSDAQPTFLDAHNKPIGGFLYRAQDEYLEWVTMRDPDGVVREIWFTCEGPEYWQTIAADRTLLVTLYAELMGVAANGIDSSKLYFQEACSQANLYGGGPIQYKAGDYNPYNGYNAQWAIHLTQGANTLGAEIALAQGGSLIWGNPVKSSNPDLICCAEYGDPNRNSDPKIGKEVNDLVRTQMYVTLRDPIGLYIQPNIDPSNFTDWNNAAIVAIGSYFVPTRMSADGKLVLRARFAVPPGVMRNGKQARVGDLNYMGVPIQYGGQVADAILMNLFAQALPGALAQKPQSCRGHACFSPTNPSYIITAPAGKPCPTQAGTNLLAEVIQVRKRHVRAKGKAGAWSRVALYD
jgi:hypothetical protein